MRLGRTGATSEVDSLSTQPGYTPVAHPLTRKSGRPDLRRERVGVRGYGFRSSPPSPDLLRKSTSPRRGEVDGIRGKADSIKTHSALALPVSTFPELAATGPRVS